MRSGEKVLSKTMHFMNRQQGFNGYDLEKKKKRGEGERKEKRGEG